MSMIGRRWSIIILIGLFGPIFGLECNGQIGQRENSNVPKKYMVWVKYGQDIHASAPQIQGRLMAVGESSIMIQSQNNEKVSYTLDIVEIESLEFQENDANVGGIVAGGVLGALVGASMMGGSSSNSSTNLLTQFAYAASGPGRKVLGGVVGLVAGAALGSLIKGERITISLNGNYETYAQKRADLQRFLWTTP